MTNYITKFRSLDGLVLYEFRAYRYREDYIERGCVLPLRVATAKEEVPNSMQIIRRCYKIYDEYFDQEKGMFVREYREEYRG